MVLKNRGCRVENLRMEIGLLKQGAEARLHKTTFFGRPAILKVRFPKQYRHPDLDHQLTKSRLRSELKGILRCKSLGIRTPTIYFVDNKRNSIYMESLENVETVDVYITTLLKEFIKEKHGDDGANSNSISKLNKLAYEIGTTVGKMHTADVIHGDLTTSNILVDLKPDACKADIILIDFGLSYIERLAEDKGVDLYVLERALLSTHSSITWFFEDVLESYKVSNVKDGTEVLKKLHEIRLRGRKRTMVG